MSSQRKLRAEKRAKYKAPKNYTCGACRKVHVYDKEKPYECPLLEVSA